MDRDTEETKVETTNEPVSGGTVRRERVSRAASVPGVVVAQRVVWFIVGVIVILLALRMLLLLLAANRGNAFVDFIYNLSGAFAAPFYGIFNYQPQYGSSVFELSSLVAILIYALVGWLLVSLVTLGSRHRDDV